MIFTRVFYSNQSPRDLTLAFTLNEHHMYEEKNILTSQCSKIVLKKSQ